MKYHVNMIHDIWGQKNLFNNDSFFWSQSISWTGLEWSYSYLLILFLPVKLFCQGYESRAEWSVPLARIPDSEDYLGTRVGSHNISPVNKAGHVTHCTVITNSKIRPNLFFCSITIFQRFPEVERFLTRKYQPNSIRSTRSLPATPYQLECH